MNIQGKGKWLIVGNPSPGGITITNPNAKRDEDHIVLRGFEEKVIKKSWLNVPYFAQDVEAGRLTLRYSDEPPDNRFIATNIMGDLTRRGFQPNVAWTIFLMCATDPLPPELDQYISLEPSPENKARFGDTYIGPRWDLLRDHKPFLEEVLALEQRWRNRVDIVERIKTRISELVLWHTT